MKEMPEENAVDSRRAQPGIGWRRLRLVVAYDGTPWQGWQSMPHGRTVQDQLNAALTRLAGERVRCHGAGRTDAGVHALGQVAHADVPESIVIPTKEWPRAINSFLPPSIRALQVESVTATFHAQFDAAGKKYRYRLWRADVLHPLEVNRVWHVFGELDLACMQRLAARLVGEQDFARFSAFRGSRNGRSLEPVSTLRTLYSVEIREQQECVEIEFAGDGFLYKMVRMLVGSLVQVARGRASEDWFMELLTRPQDGPKTHHTAPADGLYLVCVRYPLE